MCDYRHCVTGLLVACDYWHCHWTGSYCVCLLALCDWTGTWYSVTGWVLAVTGLVLTASDVTGTVWLDVSLV